MCLVSYNGVSLPYSDLTRFRHDVIYDPEGKTDAYLSRFDIEVQCIINLSYIDQLLPGSFDAEPFQSIANAATIMQYLQVQLMRPRKFLSVIFNDTELIPKVEDNRGTVDSENGPKPMFAELVQTTDVTFILMFRIQASYFIKATFDPNDEDKFRTVENGAPVLYNRWAETISIDNCNYSRRIRQGKYVIRSDNDVGGTVDDFRGQMAVLGIPFGFLRESAQYTVDPNGLGLAYTIIDKEVFKLPPSLGTNQTAYEADGEYAETSVNNGARKVGMCRVRLKGSKTTDQVRMLDRALGICALKLRLQGANLILGGGNVGPVAPGLLPGNFGKLEKCVVMTKLYENEVECSMETLMDPDTSQLRFHGVAGLTFGANFGATPGSDGNQARTPIYPLRGTAGNYLIQAAAYYDPSLQGTTINLATDNLNRGLVPGTAGRRLE